MKQAKFCAVAAMVLTLAVSAGAWGLTINFDPPNGQVPAGDLPAGLSAMGNSPGASVPTSAQLSDQYSADGVLFSSTEPFVAVVNNGSSVATPPNGIGGVATGGVLSYADPVTFTFIQPGLTTPGVTGNLSVQADSSGIAGQFATVNAFDINGTLIKSETLEDVGSEVWTINIPGIHSATFNFPTTSLGVPTTGSAFGNGTGIALDDLTFGAVTAPGASGPVGVPLPPMVWEMLVLLASLAGIRVVRERMRRECESVKV